MRMLLRHRKRPAAVEPSAVPSVLRVDEAQRISAVIADARSKLGPFAKLSKKREIFKYIIVNISEKS